MKTLIIFSWIARITVAVILLQTLYFKFTGAPESIYIFETLGMEPWGRIGTGVMELLAAILILIPSTRTIGALMAFGIISGAIFFHITILGIEIQGDGGLLFYLAVAVFISSLYLVILNLSEIPFINKLSFVKT
ncbi:MAG: DoxX family protein [Saprospiraceae bacterium]